MQPSAFSLIITTAILHSLSPLPPNNLSTFAPTINTTQEFPRKKKKPKSAYERGQVFIALPSSSPF
jgi:hypothetical protein